MADPVSLTAAGIAVLILTKAFEKIGEKVGEKAIEAGNKLLLLLKRKDPETAGKIEQVAQQPALAEQQPADFGVAELVNKVEALAQQDTEVKAAVDEVAATTAQSNPSVIQNFNKLAEKIGVVNQGTILNQNNTLNF
jgi:hypothetical protein